MIIGYIFTEENIVAKQAEPWGKDFREWNRRIL